MGRVLHTSFYRLLITAVTPVHRRKEPKHVGRKPQRIKIFSRRELEASPPWRIIMEDI